MAEAFTTGNPCKDDNVRRGRAYEGRALVQRDGVMERRIEFIVGYDHTPFPEACGGGGHGKHGMEMAFILVGPAGAVQWKIAMLNWFPGNVDMIGHVGADHPFSVVPATPRIGDTMAVDLGYHSFTPHWDEQGRFECDVLPEGYCYYDGSGLNAEPVLAAFLAHGPHAVWASLARYYMETFGDERRHIGGFGELIHEIGKAVESRDD